MVLLLAVLVDCAGSSLQHAGPTACGIYFPTRDWTSVPCIERWILNHWTTRVVQYKMTFEYYVQFGSIQFSRWVVSDSLRPHEPQYTRPPCLSPTPIVHPNPCPLSRWCHPTISSSVVPLSSCPQSFPVSGSFPMSQFLTSGGQSIGVSTSPSLLPINIQDWFSLGLTGWICFLSKWLSRIFSNTTVQKLSKLLEQWFWTEP